MAVFEGARLGNDAMPAAGMAVRRARVAAPASARPAQRVRPIGLLMAGIMAATLLGLVYLTQTLGANATDSEIRKLSVESAQLEDKLRRQAVYVQTYADAVEITTRAKKLELRRLGDVVVLPAP